MIPLGIIAAVFTFFSMYFWVNMGILFLNLPMDYL